MASGDEVVKLILDADASKVEDARRTIQATTSDTYEFAQSIQHVSGETYEFADDAKFLDVVLTDVDKTAKRIAGSNDAAAASLKRLAAATHEAKSGAAGFGQSMLQSGRFVQDFAQGGIGGVLNNIEGLTVALGMGSGLAGVLTIVGVAAALAGPKLMEWGRSLLEVRHDVPQAADDLKRMEDSIKANAKALDELREKTSLSSDELKRFNELTDENARLEKQAAEEKKRRQDLEQFSNLKSDQEKEEAGAFTKAIQEGGPGEAARVKAELVKALKQRSEYNIKDYERQQQERISRGETTIDDEVEMAKQLEQFKRDQRQGHEQLADRYIQGAMQGNTTLINGINELATGGYGAHLTGFAARLQGHRDEKRKKEEEAEVSYIAQQSDQGERESDRLQKLAEDARKKRGKALSDRLDQLGQEDDDRTAAAERARNLERQQQRPIITQQLHRENDFLGHTGIVEQAALMQAQLQSRGMSGAAAEERARAAVEQHLRQNFGMTDANADVFGLSSVAAGRGRQQGRDASEHAYAQAIAQGASVNEASIYANAQMLQTLSEAAAKFSGQAQQLRSQGRRAATMRMQFRGMAPPGGSEG